MMNKLTIGALAIGLLITPAAAGTFPTPSAAKAFCSTYPAQCKSGGKSQIGMSKDLMTTLKRVNARVNRSIKMRIEKVDKWSVNVKFGDCEDYALTKRAELIKLGIPASSLRIGKGYTAPGVGHAVLIVRTSKGDYVLDNRRRAIKKMDKTGIDWRAMSGPALREWERI